MVACSAKADLLVLLSDIEGLYTADPRKDPGARLIPVVEEITPDIEALAGGAGSGLATGGMATKLRAAQHGDRPGLRHGHHQRRAARSCSMTSWRAKQVGTRFREKKPSPAAFPDQGEMSPGRR